MSVSPLLEIAVNFWETPFRKKGTKIKSIIDPAAVNNAIFVIDTSTLYPSNIV